MNTLVYLAGFVVLLSLAVLAEHVPSVWVTPIVVAAYAVGAAQVWAYTYGLPKRGDRS